MKVFKHIGDNGSCIIITSTNLEMAENLIRLKLNNIGLKDEKTNVSEIEHACTQSSLVHIDVQIEPETEPETENPLGKDIFNIIQNNIDIEEGHWGWGGQEYILTNISTAVELIIKRVHQE